MDDAADIAAVLRGTALDGRPVEEGLGGTYLIAGVGPDDVLDAWRAARAVTSVTGRWPVMMQPGGLDHEPEPVELEELDLAARTVDPWSVFRRWRDDEPLSQSWIQDYVTSFLGAYAVQRVAGELVAPVTGAALDYNRSQAWSSTIYSTHPNRGKTQILTTFSAADGAQSCTVTSVEDTASAAAITDALNRISACATVPVSVYDRRGDQHAHYPQDHLPAITDPARRNELRTGAHGLWYEYVSMHLHRALSDLDEALDHVPGPVATAVGAELATEVAALRAGLAEYHEGIEPDSALPERIWDFGYPMVLPSAEPDLSPETRERMDQLDESLDDPELVHDAIIDMRLLFDAHNQSAEDSIVFEADAL